MRPATRPATRFAWLAWFAGHKSLFLLPAPLNKPQVSVADGFN